jgi:hypothetical protein
MCFEQIGGKACMHCAKGKTRCIPQGPIDGNTTEAPPKVKKVSKPARPSSRPARATKSAQVDYTLPPVPRPTKKSKKAAGKQKEVPIEAEQVQEVASSAEPMQRDGVPRGERSLFADIDRGSGISIIFLSFSLMLNNLLDAQTFLVDIVDEMQGVVQRHTVLINEMMPSFYEINSRIDLIDDIANSGRKVIMGFASTLDTYKKTVEGLARRLEIAEEKIREQAEELAMRMDTVPDVQHMMSAVQTEDAPASNAVQHESSAVQTEEAQASNADATYDGKATTASSSMPPPPPPPPPHPAVTLQPPTPQTSQEEVVQMTLLEVPVDVAHESASTTATEEPDLRRSPRHRSPSPLPSTEPRRSPRLRSPSPLPSSLPSKRPADSGDEGPAKRRREE